MTDRASADGSPVEAYALLPAEPDLKVVRQLLGERRTVLDLGCGTGRIADPLAAEGRHVVAVDESGAMLERVQVATPVQGRIEELTLNRTFEGVLLLSHLINGPDPRPLLAVAARHLGPGGVVIIQRLEPGRRWREGSSQVGSVLLSLSNLAVDLPRVVGRTTYRTPSGVWHQDWVLYERDDNEITCLLTGLGLRLASAAGSWLVVTQEGQLGTDADLVSAPPSAGQSRGWLNHVAERSATSSLYADLSESTRVVGGHPRLVSAKSLGQLFR